MPPACGVLVPVMSGTPTPPGRTPSGPTPPGLLPQLLRRIGEPMKPPVLGPAQMLEPRTRWLDTRSGRPKRSRRSQGRLPRRSPQRPPVRRHRPMPKEHRPVARGPGWATRSITHTPWQKPSPQPAPRLSTRNPVATLRRTWGAPRRRLVGNRPARPPRSESRARTSVRLRIGLRREAQPRLVVRPRPTEEPGPLMQPTPHSIRPLMTLPGMNRCSQWAGRPEWVPQFARRRANHSTRGSTPSLSRIRPGHVSSVRAWRAKAASR